MIRSKVRARVVHPCMTHSFLESDTRLGAQHSFSIQTLLPDILIASDRGNTDCSTVSAVSIVACGCINLRMYAVVPRKTNASFLSGTHQLFERVSMSCVARDCIALDSARTIIMKQNNLKHLNARKQ
jgi:hypothetical protein